MITQAESNCVKIINNNVDVLKQLKDFGLWQEGRALRLHLGCGEKHFDGYINIDFPQSEHNLMRVKADVCADIKKLDFPLGSVDEIRLHHVFEHFSRVTALAMLIKWHKWLEIGGRLHIETPDLIGSAKMLVSDTSLKIKMGVVRHLAGDQSASWGYHVDHWFPERFEHTLSRLGFKSIQTLSSSWPKEPYLSNVKVVALKSQHISLQEQLNVAEELLWESTVAPVERPTWEVWKKQLHAALAGDFVPAPGDIYTSGEIERTKPKVNNWITEGDLIFDVGAYLGSKTDTYIMKGARVVCFEPQPECVRVLREKYQNTHKVTIVDKGLADKPGKRQLLMCSSAPTISTFSHRWLNGRFAHYSWDKALPVEVTTLDEMIETYGCPKFCKIDVEGFEFEVLKGLSQPIPYLSFEFTIEFLENAKNCVAYLQDLGYKHFNLGLGERAELVFWEWVPSEALFRHVEHLDDRLLWGDIYAKANESNFICTPKSYGNTVSVSDNVQTIDVSSVSAAPIILSQNSSRLPLDEIQGFNQRTRNRWVQAKARTIPSGSRVLDVGAGTCPYRSFFKHCDYKTHDFKKYKGIKKNNTTEYGQIDYVSDITNIPVPDESFDVIICTEVLEHVPEPIEALREMARILKRGGRIFVTAPLGSGLHQLPYHYYGGLSPQWYRHFFPKFGLQLKEISPNGGFFKLLAQECARVTWTLPQHQHLHGNNIEFIQHLFGEWLPRYLFALDEKCFIDQFTVGYHVEAEKSPLLTIDRTDMPQTVGRNISPDPNMSRIGGLIFSKDRAMQLQATIESFLLHCQDEDSIDLVVLYKASNELHGGQYTELKKKFSGIDFVEESNFREQVLSAIEKCDYILFLVDDNIFVKPFSMKDITKALQREKDAVGFSLRLGKNTDYCYPFSSQQALPQFKKFSKGILKYYWPDAEYDFGYPLEVSSSVYRCQDMLQLLNRKEFVNPNTLESLMNQNKNLYNSLPYLLTYEESVTFANPVNIVQNVYENKHGTINNYTPEELADCFLQGMEVDVKQYIGLTPNAAHQETKLHFKKDSDNVVKISVIVPCYNHAHYLPEAVESIVNQTYTNWECIIVNDTSNDNTAEVAKQLIAKYPDREIRFIDKPNNSGLADTRNVGIEAATSEWILPLDSDDMFERTFMQRAVDIIHREEKVDIIFANMQEFGASNGEWIPREYSREQIMVADTMPYASLYRKDLWQKVGGYDKLVGTINQPEDWNFWISCSKYELVVKRIPEKLFLYRVDHQSMYHKMIKPNREVSWALLATCHPDLYPPQTLVDAWQLIANCPDNIYEKILIAPEKCPEYGLAYFWRALINKKQGNIDDAIKDCNMALERAKENDWQSAFVLMYWQNSLGDMISATDSLEKLLNIRPDFRWAKDILKRPQQKNDSKRRKLKILFYFDRIGNFNETSPAGTVIAILNFARALQSSNPDVEIHITGDLVHYLEQYESFRVIPLPPPEQREQFITDYDVIFFATHVRYFKGLTKPSGQIWVLWQHCWEADDRVSLSHSSDFDAVMCLSEQHRSSLRNKYFGDEKFITIPNLIDTNVYSPKGVIRNNHSIMFAGGLHPHKCVHILLDAFRLVRQQVKDAELHIYGDGKMWRGGETYGNELKSIKPEGTYFHGYVDNKDMPQNYSKHSILCLPSKLESFGLVTVEAQSCGCVPVVHNVGGVAATLADGQTGLLYSPNTPQKLAETIIRAIMIVDADPSVRQKAINFVRDTFSINRAAEYISKLWGRITIAKKVNTIRTLLEDNEIEQADFECEKLLQKNPNHPDVQLMHALIMLRQGNESKANVAIGGLLENFPNHLKALNDFGLMAMKAGDTEKALRYLTKAYKFNPWDKDTITNCYAMLTTSGKYRDAKMLLLNYLTNVGEDAQVLQLFREIDNIIANAGSEAKVVSQEVLNNKQDVYCGSSTSMPLVSIITPVYNGADYIGQTIESVLAQDYPNFELVIIDDGSTDNTKEIILLYNDERIRYLYQENKGVSSARNLAIKKAKGQYIMPLDADDMMTPDFIAKHLEEFEKHPGVDLVYCDVLLIDENSNPIRIMNKPEYQDRRYLIRDLFRAGHPVVPFRLGIRRSVFDRIGFYDEDLLIGEDYDMMRRFVKAGLKEHHLSKPLHLRRMHADSLSRNYSAQKAKSYFDVIKRFIDTFAYDELFPDVAWDEIAPQIRKLHAKCLTAGTYLAIGQDYVRTKAIEYSRTAFDHACSELNDCVKMDPENQGLRQLLQKSKLIQARYTKALQQVVSK